MPVFPCFLALLPAPQGPPPILQPHASSSRGGEYVLRVGPTRRLGDGPARYSMTRGGVELWAAEHPFSLWEACVGSNGCAAGYAYTAGFDGAARDSKLVVVFFGPGGDVLATHSTPRVERRSYHEPPSPTALGVVLSDELDRLIVRLARGSGASEQWQVYELSSGKFLEELTPHPANSEAPSPVLAERVLEIPRTPLTLVHWRGGRVDVLDSRWMPIWSFAATDRPERVRPLVEGAPRLDELAVELSAAGFELTSNRERAAFAVERDDFAASSWRVRELGRRPWAPSATPPPPEVPALELVKLAETALLAPRPPGAEALRDIAGFEGLENGATRFVRREPDARSWTLVELDRAGLVARESCVALELVEPSRWTPLADGAWLLCVPPAPTLPSAGAWRIDRSGAAQPLPALDGVHVARAVGLPDRGFAVLGRSSPEDAWVVSRFDASGARTWSSPADPPSTSQRPLGELTLTPQGELAWFDPESAALHFLGLDGRLRRSADLARTWVVAPKAPARMVALTDGQLLMLDARSDGIWRRMRPDGELQGSLRLRRRDGQRALGAHDTLQVDASGHLWTSDGQTLYRHGSDGELVKVAGRDSDPATLDEPGRSFLTSVGELGVIDRRTQSLFVFDPRGSMLRRCSPIALDTRGSDEVQLVLPRGDGGLFVGMDRYRDRFVEFDAEGQRLGVVHLGGERPAPIPGQRARWVVSQEGVRSLCVTRVERDSTRSRSVERRPDGRWFTWIVALGAGGDGELAALDGFGLRQGDELTLCLYDATGAPLAQIELGAATRELRLARRITLGERWVALDGDGETAYLVRRATGEVFRFRAAASSSESSSWAHGFAPNGRELWSVRAEPPTLLRFALPD